MDYRRFDNIGSDSDDDEKPTIVQRLASGSAAVRGYEGGSDPTRKTTSSESWGKYATSSATIELYRSFLKKKSEIDCYFGDVFDALSGGSGGTIRGQVKNENYSKPLTAYQNLLNEMKSFRADLIESLTSVIRPDASLVGNVLDNELTVDLHRISDENSLHFVTKSVLEINNRLELNCIMIHHLQRDFSKVIALTKLALDDICSVFAKFNVNPDYLQLLRLFYYRCDSMIMLNCQTILLSEHSHIKVSENLFSSKLSSLHQYIIDMPNLQLLSKEMLCLSYLIQNDINSLTDFPVRQNTFSKLDQHVGRVLEEAILKNSRSKLPYKIGSNGIYASEYAKLFNLYKRIKSDSLSYMSTASVKSNYKGSNDCISPQVHKDKIDKGVLMDRSFILNLVGMKPCCFEFALSNAFIKAKELEDMKDWPSALRYYESVENLSKEVFKEAIDQLEKIYSAEGGAPPAGNAKFNEFQLFNLQKLILFSMLSSFNIRFDISSMNPSDSSRSKNSMILCIIQLILSIIQTQIALSSKACSECTTDFSSSSNTHVDNILELLSHFSYRLCESNENNKKISLVLYSYVAITLSKAAIFMAKVDSDPLTSFSVDEVEFEKQEISKIIAQSGTEVNNLLPEASASLHSISYLHWHFDGMKYSASDLELAANNWIQSVRCFKKFILQIQELPSLINASEFIPIFDLHFKFVNFGMLCIPRFGSHLSVLSFNSRHAIFKAINNSIFWYAKVVKDSQNEHLNLLNKSNEVENSESTSVSPSSSIFSSIGSPVDNISTSTKNLSVIRDSLDYFSALAEFSIEYFENVVHQRWIRLMKAFLCFNLSIDDKAFCSQVLDHKYNKLQEIRSLEEVITMAKAMKIISESALADIRLSIYPNSPISEIRSSRGTKTGVFYDLNILEIEIERSHSKRYPLTWIFNKSRGNYCTLQEVVAIEKEMYIKESMELLALYDNAIVLSINHVCFVFALNRDKEKDSHQQKYSMSSQLLNTISGPYLTNIHSRIKHMIKWAEFSQIAILFLADSGGSVSGSHQIKSGEDSQNVEFWLFKNDEFYPKFVRKHTDAYASKESLNYIIHLMSSSYNSSLKSQISKNLSDLPGTFSEYIEASALCWKQMAHIMLKVGDFNNAFDTLVGLISMLTSGNKLNLHKDGDFTLNSASLVDFKTIILQLDISRFMTSNLDSPLLDILFDAFKSLNNCISGYMIENENRKSSSRKTIPSISPSIESRDPVPLQVIKLLTKNKNFYSIYENCEEYRLLVTKRLICYILCGVSVFQFRNFYENTNFHELSHDPNRPNLRPALNFVGSVPDEVLSRCQDALESAASLFEEAKEAHEVVLYYNFIEMIEQGAFKGLQKDFIAKPSDFDGNESSPCKIKFDETKRYLNSLKKLLHWRNDISYFLAHIYLWRGQVKTALTEAQLVLSRAPSVLTFNVNSDSKYSNFNLDISEYDNDKHALLTKMRTRKLLAILYGLMDNNKALESELAYLKDLYTNQYPKFFNQPKPSLSDKDFIWQIINLSKPKAKIGSISNSGSLLSNQPVSSVASETIQPQSNSPKTTSIESIASVASDANIESKNTTETESLSSNHNIVAGNYYLHVFIVVVSVLVIYYSLNLTHNM